MLALTLDGTTLFLPDADKESAMQRYWQARQDGDTTAHLKFLPGEPPEPDPDPPPPSAGAAAAVPDNGCTASGTVSALALERIALHEQWLAKAGFHLPPPLYAPGTRVLPLGDHNFRMERRRVEELPCFPEAAQRVREQIRSEQRGDLTVRLGDLAMDDSGNLEAGAFRLGLELDAFRQLAILAGFGMGARYLAECCDAQLRGENVTWQLRNRSKSDREVVLRTRAGKDGARSAYAVVTPTYAAVDSDEVLDLVAAPLADARAEVLYDGTGLRATALFLPDQVVDLAAGDVFKVGVRVQTDDTGRGRIRVSAVAFRNLCLNLLIIGEGEVQTLAQVHRGDASKIREAVREGVVRARESVGVFLESWGHARQVHIEDPAQTLERWVTTGKISVQGERDHRQTAEEFLRAWRKEPGDTLADLVNAVSRAAHEVPRWGQSARDDLERQAGALVMAAA